LRPRAHRPGARKRQEFPQAASRRRQGDRGGDPRQCRAHRRADRQSSRRGSGRIAGRLSARADKDHPVPAIPPLAGEVWPHTPQKAPSLCPREGAVLSAILATLSVENGAVSTIRKRTRIVMLEHALIGKVRTLCRNMLWV